MASRRINDLVSLCGYFVPNSKYDVDESESDGDEEDFENLDFKQMTAISHGAALIPSKPIGRKKGKLKLLSNGQEVGVYGRFIMDDPWWQVTVKVKKTLEHKNQRVFVRGFPAYQLRNDRQVGPQKVVNLFLKACLVEEQHLVTFNNFLRNVGFENKLTFENLKENLNRFGKISKENECIVEEIWDRCFTHEKGVCVKQWLQHEDPCLLFTMLPQLLPRHFVQIMAVTEAQQLAQLQSVLSTDPWQFGFSAIMSFRHKLIGCEAQLDSFYNTGLMDKIPVTQKDALHIYHVLKHGCNRYGHTYQTEKRLVNSEMFNNLDYKVSNWPKALQFLLDNHVTQQEADQVYLRSLWRAELTISQVVSSLFYKHVERPCVFPLDYNCDEFEQIRLDKDQLMAAYLCSQSPLVVISGKGGCGKTTVVSRVFKQVEKWMKAVHMSPLKHRSEQSLEFDQTEVDDSTLSQSVAQIEKDYFMSQSQLEETKADTMTVLTPSKTTVEERWKMPLEGSTSSMIKKASVGGSTSSSIHDDDEDEDECDQIGNHRILLTAPTGKAASLLGTRSKLPAFTLHQINFSFKFFKKKIEKLKKAGKQYKDLRWKHSEVEVLITDESSLVSVRTFSTLLDVLMSHAQLRKVVLLGDVNQLPSIEPGNFMSDIFQSMKKMGCSITLGTNHRSESQLIVDNASLIAQMKMPRFNPRENFHLIKISDLPPGVAVGSSHDVLSFDIDKAVKKLLSTEEFGKGSDKDHQFVAFRKIDCQRINELCCLHYSQHSMCSHKKRIWLQVGDKVCCTKNANVKLHPSPRHQLSSQTSLTRRGNAETDNGNDTVFIEDVASPQKTCPAEKCSTSSVWSDTEEEGKEKKQKAKRRLCNGEVFFIEDDWEEQIADSRERYLSLRDELGKLIHVNYREVMKVCRLKHAWARTIHTYQGSESDTVVYVVGSATGFQTWQHVYTAITRGRKQVTIVSRMAELTKAVSQPQKFRYTSLAKRLNQHMAKLPVSSRFSEAQKKEALTRILTSFEDQNRNSSTVHENDKSEAANSHQDTSQILSQPQFESNKSEGTNNNTYISDQPSSQGQSELNSSQTFSDLSESVYDMVDRLEREAEHWISADEEILDRNMKGGTDPNILCHSTDFLPHAENTSENQLGIRPAYKEQSTLQLVNKNTANNQSHSGENRVSRNLFQTTKLNEDGDFVENISTNDRVSVKRRSYLEPEGSPSKQLRSGPHHMVPASPARRLPDNELSQQSISPMRRSLSQIGLR